MMFDSDAFPCFFPLRILFFFKCFLSIIKRFCVETVVLKCRAEMLSPSTLEIVRGISCLWGIFCFHSGNPIHLDTFIP